MKLCIPADFSIETVRSFGAAEIRDDSCIHETYGNLNPSPLLGSGRGSRNPGLPLVDIETLAAYLTELHDRGIRFNYTANSSCLKNMDLTAQGRRRVLSFIDSLIQVGVDAFTVTSTSLIQLIKVNFPKAEICASVIIGVDSLQKAKNLQDLGVNRLVLLEDENRNFGLLKALSKHCRIKIELIANPKCAFLCPMRANHYNSLAHDDLDENYYSKYYSDFCEGLALSNFLKIRWIRPEDVEHYEAVGIEHFKLIERVNVDQTNLYGMVRAYLDRHYNGNILELLYTFKSDNQYLLNIPNKQLNGFLNYWLENRPNCRELCGGECHYCEKYFENCALEVLPNLVKPDAELFFKYGVVNRLDSRRLQRIVLESGI